MRRKKIEKCIRMTSITKTLRMAARPVGKTQYFIEEKKLLEMDETRNAEYKELKKIIDKYHQLFIDRVLLDFQLNEADLREYFTLFNRTGKTDADKKQLQKLEEALRKSISKTFKDDSEFKLLFGKELITDILPRFVEKEEDRVLISHFSKFTTVLNGFHENRSNIYSDKAINTGIANRCINDNLQRYIKNIKSFDSISKVLSQENLDKLEEAFDGAFYNIRSYADVVGFNQVLSQKGIDSYNLLLSGYTTDQGEKIQGLNEYINLYNQQLSKDKKEPKIPKLIPLYKQILSDHTSGSYIEAGFENSEELLREVGKLYKDILVETTIRIKELFANLAVDWTGIYILNGPAITDLSQALTGDWKTIRQNWNQEYDQINRKKEPKNLEEYEDERNKSYKKITSFSLDKIAALTGITNLEEVVQYYKQEILKHCEQVMLNYQAADFLFDVNYQITKDISNDNQTISLLKNLLDETKNLQGLLHTISVRGNEEHRDEAFYGEFVPLVDMLCEINAIYNKTRNYVTKKTYSKDKFKLYFENPQFMNGWDKGKVADYRATLMRKDGHYYVAVIDKKNSNILESLPADEVDNYELLNYKLLPGPNKMLPKVFFSKKGVDDYKPSQDVLNVYEKGTFKKGDSFNKDDLYLLIDFYKKSLAMHNEWSKAYSFRFKETQEYNDISEFYHDVSQAGYRVMFDLASANKIDELVENGNIYLFELYNKDFSKKSHGIKNLHTLYFLNLFNEENLNDTIIKLNGEAEMFFRPASIAKEDRTIHAANQPIATKNPLNKKKNVVFTYDIVKDKRYTTDQYMFHVPITINWNRDAKINLNTEVRRMLKHDENPYIIGIDRGERNLLYVCVIDGKGKIVEQFSLNELINEVQGIQQKVDYHNLLDKKEKERLKARQDWNVVKNIKELKEGYISQAVHKICLLVEKYDAVIAMEDLNNGFKNSRVKVEKQVYQKFEKMLINKLNYMVNKQRPSYENGGVMKGYQLTNRFESFKKMTTQNGFIFYIPAWLTSKMDPETGFVDLLKPNYSKKELAKEFFNSFEYIRFNRQAALFEFGIDYAKFPRASADYKKQWILYSYGERIKRFRNPAKNNEWDYELIDLTNEFKLLFEKYGINLNKDCLIGDICAVDNANFFKELMELMKLLLQMRNSISGTADIDYIISPVKNASGEFYDSRNAKEGLPKDADANGAFNIARKVLWAIQQFKKADEDNLQKTKIAISNQEWLMYAQGKEK